MTLDCCRRRTGKNRRGQGSFRILKHLSSRRGKAAERSAVFPQRFFARRIGRQGSRHALPARRGGKQGSRRTLPARRGGKQGSRRTGIFLKDGKISPRASRWPPFGKGAYAGGGGGSKVPLLFDPSGASRHLPLSKGRLCGRGEPSRFVQVGTVFSQLCFSFRFSILFSEKRTGRRSHEILSLLRRGSG